MPIVRFEMSLIWIFVFLIVIPVVAFGIGWYWQFTRTRRDDKTSVGQDRREADLAYQIMSLVSHRLKTVGEVIRGHLRRLDENALPLDLDRWRVARRAIWEEASEVPNLTDRIDVLVRLGVAGQPLVMEPVNLAAVIEDLMLGLSPAADAKGIVLGGVVQRENNGDVVVSGDSTALRVAFSNLLENALHHNISGTEITASISRQSDTVQVDISDTGDGIPDQVIDRLFQKGSRSYSPGRSGGSGMGLYLTRLLIELHGGELEAKNDHGAHFLITLPVRRAG